MSVLDHIERNLHTLEEMLGELGDNGVEAPALPLLSLPLPSELSRIEANIQELEDVQNSEEGAVGGVSTCTIYCLFISLAYVIIFISPYPYVHISHQIYIGRHWNS